MGPLLIHFKSFVKFAAFSFAYHFLEMAQMQFLGSQTPSPPSNAESVFSEASVSQVVIVSYLVT